MDYLVQKWACQYCTYENWPASKFCVLCRAPKPAMYIDDSGIQRSEDMRKVNSPEGEQLFPHQEKWSCPACTFLNWPRSMKCTQCHTPRKAVESPETLKKSIGESQSYETNNSSESDECQIHSPEPEKAVSKNLSKINTKWTCNVCTYKNWFQTRLCTYCGTSKHKCKQLSRKLRVTQENEINKISSDSGGRVILEESFENLSLGVTPLHNKSEERRGMKVEATLPEGGKSPPPMKDLEDDQPFLDWLWLAACKGVLEDDVMAVEEYLTTGGDPARTLTYSDVKLLGRPSAFTAGFTLVHLAIRFKREQILAILLTASDASNKTKKRVPSLVAYEIANQINKELRLCLEQKRRHFQCYHFGELSTFLLPAEIHAYHPLSRKLLFEELLDENAQKELEEEKVINWSQELISIYRCRLFPLWNRTAGDCLLDSILQSTWGIMDTDNVLRKALFNSLVECREEFYTRWREHELIQADLMNYTLNENQLKQDWETLLMHAKQPGSSLEQVHILVLAHILRRPIIVYGIKYVKNLHGDNIGYAGFQGVYLPLFWDPSYCWRTPVVLGYTRGHFSALVSVEPDVRSEAATSSEVTPEDIGQVINLPLVDSEEKLLPVHFLTQSDRGLEEAFLYQWLDCFVTEGGLLVCEQRSFRSHVLSRQMVSQWLEKYRNFSKMVSSRFSEDEGEG